MLKRTVLLGAALAVVAAALVVNLAILDVISFTALRETLGKTLSVIAVTTVAVVLVLAMVKATSKP
ncbi:MAG: hypothetical protein EHM88_02300 [Candidatus Rokuibacteriota bacterium]|jgi:hypothetical protein|nr:MAG: hypothetical protein EHM88_02300 [Candidatus Rokubacteria bacterium]